MYKLIFSHKVAALPYGHGREKGMGCDSPAVILSLYAPNALCSSAKAGHWETEKAEHKRAKQCFIRCEPEDLLCCGSVRALNRNHIFVCANG